MSRPVVVDNYTMTLASDVNIKAYLSALKQSSQQLKSCKKQQQQQYMLEDALFTFIKAAMMRKLFHFLGKVQVPEAWVKIAEGFRC